MTNIAILGAGSIARTMARTLRMMKARGDAVELYAVASRSLERAQAFAREEGFACAYGSYEELVQDPAVELVYIATPHSHHAAQMELCIDHGKHVLCEKSFTANAAQAEAVLQRARQKGVLVTEAIWTRYMPMRSILSELIASGEIGTPRLLTANLCYPLLHKERILRPELAGGALLDVGGLCAQLRRHDLWHGRGAHGQQCRADGDGRGSSGECDLALWRWAHGLSVGICGRRVQPPLLDLRRCGLHRGGQRE